MVGVSWTHIARTSSVLPDTSATKFFMGEFIQPNPTTDHYGMYTVFKLKKCIRNIFMNNVQLTLTAGIGINVSYFVSFFGYRYLGSDGNPIPLPLYGTDFMFNTSKNLTDTNITNWLTQIDAAGGPNGNGTVPIGAGIFLNNAQVIPMTFTSSYTKENQVFNVYEMVNPINELIPAMNAFDLEFKIIVYPVDINANGTFEFIPSNQILSFTTYAEVT